VYGFFILFCVGDQSFTNEVKDYTNYISVKKYSHPNNAHVSFYGIDLEEISIKLHMVSYKHLQNKFLIGCHSRKKLISLTLKCLLIFCFTLGILHELLNFICNNRKSLLNLRVGGYVT
jgi:hypothetical protein